MLVPQTRLNTGISSLSLAITPLKTMVLSVSNEREKAKVLAKVLADSRKFKAVSHCSLASQTSRSTSSGNVSASEIFSGQLKNRRLFLPLLVEIARSKISNRRSESRTLYDAILGTFPLRPAQRRPRFLPVSVSSSFNAVTGVQRCRKTVRNSGF